MGQKTRKQEMSIRVSRPNPLLNSDAREASHLGRASVAARRLAQR